MDANITSVFSLPFFNNNFAEEGITDKELAQELNKAIYKFQNAI